MALNQLALIYPDVKYEVSHGKKRLARVTVEYNITGSPEAIEEFLEMLDKEWPFSHQRCKANSKGMSVEVEYLVKAEEEEEFIKSVPYRGKKITLVS